MTNRELPKNIYYSDKYSKPYYAQIGRWYWNIRLPRCDTVEEAQRELDNFYAEFGTLNAGPKGEWSTSFRKLFPDAKTRTITLQDFREWHNCLVCIADAERNARR